MKTNQKMLDAKLQMLQSYTGLKFNLETTYGNWYTLFKIDETLNRRSQIAFAVGKAAMYSILSSLTELSSELSRELGCTQCDVPIIVKAK